MNLKLYKMEGCGNDFLIIDALRDAVPALHVGEVRYLCNRFFGLGADGLVILTEPEEDSPAHTKWIFYNSDGSEAEMCGNAARCVVRFISDRYLEEPGVVGIETKAGLIRGQVLPDSDKVEITMMPQSEPNLTYESKVIEADGDIFEVFFLNTGVPHAVIQVKDLLNYPVEKVGMKIMKHPAFAPAETNVTFMQQRVGNQILSTTVERGVEAQTFACGTGAVAAAAVYSELYMQDLPILVQVPGGTLEVDLSPVTKMLLLRGPANYVYKTVIEENRRDFEVPEKYGNEAGEINELILKGSPQ